MTTTEETIGALSPEAEKVLEERGLYSIRQPKADEVSIYTSDEGELVCRVSPTISAFDLYELLRRVNLAYARGVEAGKRDTQYAIRAALGMAS